MAIYQRRFSENLFQFAEKVMSLKEPQFYSFSVFQMQVKINSPKISILETSFSVIVDGFFQKRIYFTP